MRIVKPAYYDTFRCLAGACPDTCCKDWDILVDEESAEFYRTLPGELGERVRRALTEEDGETILLFENGRCPLCREDGLCSIQAQLGHDALCRTCQEFPRLTHDYGTFLERGLELSCPEAARIVLTAPAEPIVQEEVPGGDEPEYDLEAMEQLLRSRQVMRQILSDRSRPVQQVLVLALMYGYQAQAELDGAEVQEFDPEAALEEAAGLAHPGSAAAILDFLKELDILTERWRIRLDAPDPAPWTEPHLALMRYFVDRYWLQAVSDYDLVSRVKLGIVSTLTVRILGGDPISTAQLYSKEIENSAENVDALLDGAYTAPAFTDDKLLGLLLAEEI